jgi:hypothetical protein
MSRLWVITLLTFAWLFLFVYIKASGDYVFDSGDFCKYYGCNKNGIDGNLKK